MSAKHAVRQSPLREKVCNSTRIVLVKRSVSCMTTTWHVCRIRLCNYVYSGHTVERLYTFARMVPLQPPTANTKRGTFRSRMTLGRKLRGLSREPSYDEAGGSVKAQSITDIDALDVAEQLTLRLHYLYCSVPSDQMLHDMHSSPELTRCVR